MRNYLIKLLGGFNRIQWEQYLEQNQKQLEDVIRRAGDDLNYFKDQIVDKDLEIQRLTNLIFMDRGFIRSGEVKTQSDIKSIQKRHISPKERQRQLELNDLEVHSEMLKQRWNKENGTESDSTGTSAS